MAKLLLLRCAGFEADDYMAKQGDEHQKRNETQHYTKSRMFLVTVTAVYKNTALSERQATLTRVVGGSVLVTFDRLYRQGRTRKYLDQYLCQTIIESAVSRRWGGVTQLE